jgi:hypothetical protein
VQQQSRVAQNLKLLADFIADVAIVRMQLFKLPLEDVGVGSGEPNVPISRTDPFSFSTRFRPVFCQK